MKGSVKPADFIENRLESELAVAALSPADRRLLQELVYGIIRWRAALDWLIARKTAGRTQKPVLQTLLRLGLYQMFWLDRIPDHAAVHETVELAREEGCGPQSGFINAVLRGYAREKDATRELLKDLQGREPHVGWSHPEWLWQRWQARWGAADAVRLMAWNNAPPKTFARVNALKIEPAALIEQWRGEGVEYDFVRRDWFEEGLVFEIKSHPPIASWPSFQAGSFYIQDPGTLLAVRMMNPQPGALVLDACAAPGGKTTFIAQAMRNQGRVVAGDVSEDKLKLVRENCARLGATCVEMDAPGGTAGLAFDCALVDAPCSNSGVIRRRVELRWRIRLEEIERLRDSQLAILRATAPRVKPGGALIYSTCSLEPEENAQLVEAFLSEHPAWQCEAQRTLLPFTDDVDGAFVARLVCTK